MRFKKFIPRSIKIILVLTICYSTLTAQEALASLIGCERDAGTIYSTPMNSAWNFLHTHSARILFAIIIPAVYFFVTILAPSSKTRTVSTLTLIAGFGVLAALAYNPFPPTPIRYHTLSYGNRTYVYDQSNMIFTQKPFYDSTGWTLKIDPTVDSSYKNEGQCGAFSITPIIKDKLILFDKRILVLENSGNIINQSVTDPFEFIDNYIYQFKNCSFSNGQDICKEIAKYDPESGREIWSKELANTLLLKDDDQYSDTKKLVLKDLFTREILFKYNPVRDRYLSHFIKPIRPNFLQLEPTSELLNAIREDNENRSSN